MSKPPGAGPPEALRPLSGEELIEIRTTEDVTI
jgi:hypothetical protein